MKRKHIGALVMLLLASAVGADGADFYRMANSCWFTRMPSAQRPVCCDFSAKDRFTEVGGDCCKVMYWEAQAPALDAFVTWAVLPAIVAVWVGAEPAPEFVRMVAPVPPADARGPPYRFHPTRHIVSLI